MKLFYLVATISTAQAFGAFGDMAEMAEDWDCEKYDEKNEEAYMKAGIHRITYNSATLWHQFETVVRIDFGDKLMLMTI